MVRIHLLPPNDDFSSNKINQSFIIHTMAITKAYKEELIQECSGNKTNTGSTEAQVTILTAEINAISNHINANPKDFSSQRGLHKKVSQRRNLLNYLKDYDIERYRALIKKLGLRN
jgi:small subunit ribosomal protein S15